MQNKLGEYWWENKLDELLHEHSENEYLSSADIKLFILKAIETEVEKEINDIVEILNGGKLKIKQSRLQ